MVFDIDFFRHFSKCFGSNIYIDTSCEPFGDTIFFMPNYPIFGIIFTSGFFRLFNNFINDENYIYIFRNYLAIFDSVNIYLFYKILSFFNSNQKYYKILFFAVVPSTIVSGSAFGQIDHLLITFSFLSSYFIFKNIRELSLYKEVNSINFILGVFFFFTLLFTKQHSLFLLPYFFFLFLILTFLMIKISIKIFIEYFIYFIIILLFFLFIDLYFFKVPRVSGINSVYLHTLFYGMGAASVLSIHGMNVWSILDKFGIDIFHSQNNSIGNLLIFDQFSIEIIPSFIGLLLVLTLIFIFITKYLHYLIKFDFINLSQSSLLDLIKLTIIMNSIIILTYCNFMTGINIRYIYQFYPFSFLVFFCIGRIKFLYFFLLFLSSILFASIISESIGIKFLNQFFPVFDFLNNYSKYPKFTDMQIIGFFINLILLIYLLKFLPKIKSSFFKHKFIFIMFFVLISFYIFENNNLNNINIEINIKDEHTENYYLYLDLGRGFSEENKFSFQSNNIKNNNILFIDKNFVGKIAQIRLDPPDKNNLEFNILSFSINGEKLIFEDNITLKGLKKLDTNYITSSDEDPYLIKKISTATKYNISGLMIFLTISILILIEILNILYIFYKSIKKVYKFRLKSSF